jgi:heptosyltransferase-2
MTPLGNPGKILVRSTNWIGDAVMTSPALRTIRHNFPKAQINLLARPWVADLFAACPHLDHIHLYDKQEEHQGWQGKLRLAAALRAEQYDAAILLQNAFEAALLAYAARIPVRAGYNSDGRGLLLTDSVRRCPEIKKRHQVHYYQAMLAGLGLRRCADALELFLAPKAVQEAAVLLSQAGQAENEPLIGLNPGAAYGPAKCWPKEKYAALANTLTARGYRIAVFGTRADQQAAAKIAAGAGRHVLDLTGKTNLAQAMACIARCHVFITNDSGLMHVAAALRIPIVAIFGSTDPVATGPFCEHAVIVRKAMPCSPCLQPRCPQGHFQCMKQISVAEVEQAVVQYLQKTGNK